MRISEQIFPRVVILICSTDGKKDNVMSASFLMPISFEPKYLAFSILPKRHTFKNLKKIAGQKVYPALFICFITILRKR